MLLYLKWLIESTRTKDAGVGMSREACGVLCRVDEACMRQKVATVAIMLGIVSK